MSVQFYNVLYLSNYNNPEKRGLSGQGSTGREGIALPKGTDEEDLGPHTERQAGRESVKGGRQTDRRGTSGGGSGK